MLYIEWIIDFKIKSINNSINDTLETIGLVMLMNSSEQKDWDKWLYIALYRPIKQLKNNKN